ncbi:MAG TPA: YkgJ family cysteine cluster protein [Nitrospira sp.]|nr:YkgJ family cysteine cluster protein [Nitrospira sp.]
MACDPHLAALHTDIDRRVDALRTDYPDWPCAKGCDTCCRRLAEIPRLTAAEWTLLRAGLAALPAPQRAGYRAAVARLAGSSERPLTCPFLDPQSGACPVYAHRPVACRTYGFYVDREGGLYCGDIEARVDDGRLAHVVWGHHDAVLTRLAATGETRPLTEWMAEWADDRGPVTEAATEGDN